MYYGGDVYAWLLQRDQDRALFNSRDSWCIKGMILDVVLKEIFRSLFSG